MKIIENSTYEVVVELSQANLRALFEDAESKGGNSEIVKHTQGVRLRVRVVPDADHYSEQELADRTSPYLPPEAWAGIR